jgi:hypothetical protein
MVQEVLLLLLLVVVEVVVVVLVLRKLACLGGCGIETSW